MITYDSQMILKEIQNDRGGCGGSKRKTENNKAKNKCDKMSVSGDLGWSRWELSSKSESTSLKLKGEQQAERHCWGEFWQQGQGTAWQGHANASPWETWKQESQKF